jgi:hypothetical protein
LRQACGIDRQLGETTAQQAFESRHDTGGHRRAGLGELWANGRRSASNTGGKVRSINKPARGLRCAGYSQPAFVCARALPN